jgi:hypothetical protein
MYCLLIAFTAFIPITLRRERDQDRTMKAASGGMHYSLAWLRFMKSFSSNIPMVRRWTSSGPSATRSVITESGSTVELDGSVQHTAHSLWHKHFDDGDVTPRAFRAFLINFFGAFQHQLPPSFQINAALGNVSLDGSVLLVHKTTTQQK